MKLIQFGFWNGVFVLYAAFEFSAEKAEEHLQEIKRSLLSTIMFTKIEKVHDNIFAYYD